MRIALLSDTHGYLDERIISYLKEADEVWHAGDVGDSSVANRIENLKPLKAVYGNIDGQDVRKAFAEELRFTSGGVDVYMTHIGGYPGRYSPRALAAIKASPPKLFVCGHSHILKVMFDKKYNLLHINPGAAGTHGFHHVRTMVRFKAVAGQVKDLEVIELGKRA